MNIADMIDPTEARVMAIPQVQPAASLAPTTVAVGTLVDGETVSWCWVQSMRAMEDHDRLHRRHIRTVAHVRASAGGLGKARNQMVAGYLSTQDDWLLIIDADHGFRPDTLDRLLDAAHPDERPVMGALTVGIGLDRQDGYGGYVAEPRLVAFAWDGVGFIRALSYPPDTIWPVYTGTGCLLVHRGVFERMRDRYGDTWYSTRVDGRGVELSEDLSFMLRCIELGIPVHIHTGVKTSHHKPQWLHPDDVEVPSDVPQSH